MRSTHGGGEMARHQFAAGWPFLRRPPVLPAPTADVFLSLFNFNLELIVFEEIPKLWWTNSATPCCVFWDSSQTRACSKHSCLAQIKTELTLTEASVIANGCVLGLCQPMKEPRLSTYNYFKKIGGSEICPSLCKSLYGQLRRKPSKNAKGAVL